MPWVSMMKRRTRRPGRQTRGPKLRPCSFCEQKQEPDYKKFLELHRYTTERGKILGRDRTGICRKHQKELNKAIKRARFLALMPFVAKVR